ncbi:hypothetical protein K435DRAFT_972274 [Dendrothele bispora CBS 962.96]|uniref:DUF6532 domain-containing protein n=1 Tax=Dendrothele bispora (strain CBS 962.96) TaxID=1314807 RepID=A0A4V4HC27_DENBC|nr:hypothetical protein K435DRAFT_972274 [Dendrothele bispora CBS 962.96]
MAKESEDDVKKTVDKLPFHVLRDFASKARSSDFSSHSFSTGYIEKHPELYSSFDWINVQALHSFLHEINFEVPQIEHSADRPVCVKQEPIDINEIPPAVGPVLSTRTRVITEGTHEVTLILDSDDESVDDGREPSSSQDGSFDYDPDYKNEDDLSCIDGSSTSFSSPTAIGSEGEMEVDDGFSLDEALGGGFCDVEFGSVDGDEFEEAASDMESVDGEESEVEPEWVLSDTVWLDEGIYSEVLKPQRKTVVTDKRCTVEQVERICGGFPSYFPVPRVSTAFIIDLTDTDFAALEGEMDQLIANHEQETWHGPSGRCDNKPQLSLFTGTKIACRRHRQHCSGVTACERTDPSLLNVDRFELDPEIFSDLIQRQIQSNIDEVDTVQKKTLVFWNVIHAGSCAAQNGNGPCNGVPILREWKDQKPRNGHNYFVACTGWSSANSSGHRSFSIPHGVDDELLEELFHRDTQLEGISQMSTCSRIIPSRVGYRASGRCRYPHNADGSFSTMVKHQCNAYRTIFVPLDTSIRQACIIYDIEKPHSHPALPLSKPTKTALELYRKCIEATGVISDYIANFGIIASSTQLILKGRTLGEVHPGLNDRRQQQKVINGVSHRLVMMRTKLKEPFESTVLTALGIDNSPEGVYKAQDQVQNLYYIYNCNENGVYDYEPTMNGHSAIQDRKADLFFSSLHDKPLEYEVPKAMALFASGVVHHILAETSSGTSQNFPCVGLDTNWTNLKDTLALSEKENKKKYHSFMHDIYLKASNTVGPAKHSLTREHIINRVNWAKYKEDEAETAVGQGQ